MSMGSIIKKLAVFILLPLFTLALFFLPTTLGAQSADDARFLNGCNLRIKTVRVVDGGGEKFGTSEATITEVLTAGVAYEVDDSALVIESGSSCDAKLRWFYDIEVPVERASFKGSQTPGEITFSGLQAADSGEFFLGEHRVTINNGRAVRTFLNEGLPEDVNPSAITPPENTEEEESTGDENPTCEVVFLNPFSWILCPVFNGVADLTDWLFKEIIGPALYTAPISTDPEDPSFKVWSSFRVYGNVVLVIALLVIVFGQSIGGGMIDAYTAKKVLPRIIITAILINTSVYLVALMVDVTNVLGRGVGQLMFAPFRGADIAGFELSAAQGGAGFGLGVLGAVLAAGGTYGFFTTLIAGGGAAFGTVGMYVLLTVLVPAVIALAGVFATLILRRGLILFLVMVSPVAFALYCLPNTEQYFKKWWDLLFKALLMYPVIVVVFTMADILSITVLRSSGSNPLAAIIAFALQIVPLFMIPFAFKFAGGAITGIYGAIKQGGGKIDEFAKGRKEQAAEKYHAQALHNRYSGYKNLKNIQSNANRSRLTRWGAGFAANRLGGHNMEAAISALNLKQSKEMQDQIDTGPDNEIRALSVNKELMELSKRGRNALRSSGFRESIQQADGSWSKGDYRIRDDGTIELANMSGKWYSSADVAHAYERWGGNQSAYQKEFTYEIGKALTEEDHDSIVRNLPALQQSWGLTDDQMNELVVGAGFAMQGKTKEYKHTRMRGGRTKLNAKSMVTELHGQVGTYQAMGMDAQQIGTLSEIAYEGYQQGNTQITGMVEEIANQFGGMTQAQIQQQILNANAQQAAQGQGPQMTSSAAAAAAKEIENLVQLTQSQGASIPLDSRLAHRLQSRGTDQDRNQIIDLSS